MKFQDLLAYQISFSLAMKIFEITKSFPKEEMYSLTDQIRRSSRSVPANIAEKATTIAYDFTCTGIEIYNDQKELLGSTAGLDYSDIVAPTAFAVDDLYIHLGIKRLVDGKLVLVRSPVREYAM
jgi:hypothetical protein